VTQLGFLLLVLEGLGVDCTKISKGILRNGEGSDQWLYYVGLESRPVARSVVNGN
jgi:hypothetical protein